MNLRLRILELYGLYQPLDYDYKRFECLAQRCESPMERAFWSAAYFELSKHGELTPQTIVGLYRLDFALQGDGLKIAIEIDGHDYHKSQEQREGDYKRERVLQRHGWQVIRFTGSEIFQDAASCVFEVVGLVGDSV